MAGACATPGVDDPLVRGLLTTVDCHVETLAHSGYAALFQTNGAFSGLLTTALTLYVAMFGFRLMLGQGQLRAGDLVLSAVKIGAVLALATQWGTYQTVVYETLFKGPGQLADALVTALGSDRGQGDVFDRLQRAFDLMTGVSDSMAKGAPAQGSPFLGGAGFGAFSLNIAASILLLSSLGVILAAKIVLGLLLAVGPIFVALLLFDSTRGLFEGWLRASLGFAFAPLMSTLLLGVALAMLEPSLQQLAELRAKGVFVLAPVYGVMTLILVFAAVSAGGLIAAGVIAGGFRLPRRATRGDAEGAAAARLPVVEAPPPGRAARVAQAVSSLERRESRATRGAAAVIGPDARRVPIGGSSERGGRETSSQPQRLGQGARRSARPRPLRPSSGRPR